MGCWRCCTQWGIVLAACFGKRGWLWLTKLGIIYAGLVLGSNVFHAFVVYDRISRQMLPVAALAAAHGFAAIGRGNWIRGTRGGSFSQPSSDWLCQCAATPLTAFSARICPRRHNSIW